MITKKEIEYIVNETFGPEALPIALYLQGKYNISEFVISNDLKIEIHKVRQILYKLLEDNTVIFIRKKDKIKGWYICYWSLNENEIPYIIFKIKKQKITKMKERLSQESGNHFFMCKNACTRMNFDSAFEMNFKCPDCGEIMNQQDNERTLNFLKERIAELEIEVKSAERIISTPKKFIEQGSDTKKTGLEEEQKEKIIKKKPTKKNKNIKKTNAIKKEKNQKKSKTKKNKEKTKKKIAKKKPKKIKAKAKKTTSKIKPKKKFSLFSKKTK